MYAQFGAVRATLKMLKYFRSFSNRASLRGSIYRRLRSRRAAAERRACGDQVSNADVNEISDAERRIIKSAWVALRNR